MRIAGGTLRGRRFGAKVAGSTRPTSERVREALSSALQSRGRLEGANVLDLYAGTGALAFEALSRGARRATLIEENAEASKLLRQSVQSLELGGRTRLLRARLDPAGLARLVPRMSEAPFDLVFADPPYAELAGALEVLLLLPSLDLVSRDALLVLEHPSRSEVPLPEALASHAEYRYGDTRVSFLSWSPEPELVEKPRTMEKQ